MQKSFLKAAEEAKVLAVKPNNEEMSKLYGLYKQATVGDVDIGESLHTKKSLFCVCVKLPPCRVGEKRVRFIQR